VRAGLAVLLALALWPCASLRGEEPAPAAPDPRALVGAPRGAPLAGAALDAEVKRVAGLLRCPVCQGLSVADSPVGMAVDMREQVRDMVAAGYDEEQVLVYFEKSYGEFVRLEPPLRGVNWIVWAGPLAALLAGALIVARVLRAPPAGAKAEDAPAEAPPAADALPDDPELARYVLRVRELAYGWPGGRPGAPAPGDGESGR
jgi:cytochrome c-type biogenesis protein CcmH